MLSPRQCRFVAFAAACVVLSLAACHRPEGGLTISLPHDLDTLDPHARDWIGSFAVASQLYEPLVTMDAHLNIRPGLATRWETPSLDTWVFHLRKGVLFHSGRPVTASDVVYSFERLLASNDLEIHSYLSGVASVKELDPLTVELKTHRPLAPLLKKVRFVLVVPKGATKETLHGTVDGTGPYRLSGFSPGVEVHLIRNESYWGPRPALPSVTYHLRRDTEAAIDDFVSKKSGFVQCSSKRIVDVVKGIPDARLVRSSSFMVKFLSYDVARDVTPFCDASTNPFKSPKVRQALDLAIDRQALVSRLSTFAVPVSQPVPRAVVGFNPDLEEAVPDVQRARALLAEAGYPKGFRVTLHTRPVVRETAELVRDALSAVGITVDVEVLPDPQYFSFVMARKASFFLSRFGASTGDFSDILNDAVHTRDEARHLGNSNDGGYSDPEMDQAIEASNEALDPQERARLFATISRKFREDLVWIPLYVDEDAVALASAYAWEPRDDGYVMASEITLR